MAGPNDRFRLELRHLLSLFRFSRFSPSIQNLTNRHLQRGCSTVNSNERKNRNETFFERTVIRKPLPFENVSNALDRHARSNALGIIPHNEDVIFTNLTRSESFLRAHGTDRVSLTRNCFETFESLRRETNWHRRYLLLLCFAHRSGIGRCFLWQFPSARPIGLPYTSIR